MWILPTFNRPELLKQTLAECAVANTTTKGLILINGGNQHAYTWVPGASGWGVEFLPENLGVAGAMNYAFRKYPDEPWYGWFADDLIPITPDWDAKMVAALKPGHMVSAVNNWHVPPRFQTGIVSGDLAREVGWLHLPGTWACYSDDFWETLGRELDIWTIMDDVVVETLNPRKGDYEWDEASEASYNHVTFDGDAAIWARFTANGYAEVRDKVKEKFA